MGRDHVQTDRGQHLHHTCAAARNPLKCLNSYVILDERRSLVIDTGFRMPECREALTAGLAELGVDMRRADIFLTHLHSDHSGLASELASPGSKIYITREDGRRIDEILASADNPRVDEIPQLRLFRGGDGAYRRRRPASNTSRRSRYPSPTSPAATRSATAGGGCWS